RGSVAVTRVGPPCRSAAAPRQSAAATRQRAAAAVQRRGGIRGSGAGRSGERSFPSPGMYGLRESRCSKHRSERDSSNQRFHGISPPNAFTMSGFAHLLSSSNWGEKLLPSIKSRVGVRGISHCTVKVHPRPLYEQLRQLTTKRTCALRVVSDRR